MDDSIRVGCPVLTQFRYKRPEFAALNAPDQLVYVATFEAGLALSRQPRTNTHPIRKYGKSQEILKPDEE